MTDTKLTGLTETSAVEDDDLIYLVDVSDTTDSIDGSSRKAQAKNVRGYPRTAAEIAAAILPTNYQYEPGNVLRYGDNTSPGVTDMASAVEAAINVANSASEPNFLIYFPPGEYNIPSGTSVDIASNYTWIVGDQAKITTESGTVFTFGDGSTAYSGGGISGIHFSTDGTPDSGQKCIVMDGWADLTIENCRGTTVRNFATFGISAGGSSRNATAITMRGCRVGIDTAAGSIGLDVVNGAGLRMSNITIFGDSSEARPTDRSTAYGLNANTGIRVGQDSWDTIIANKVLVIYVDKGLDVSPATGENVTNGWWDSCIFDFCKTNGILLSDATNSSTVRSYYFSKCWAVALDGHSINVTGSGTSSSIRNIRFSQCVGRQAGKNNWKHDCANAHHCELDGCHGIGANRLSANSGADQDDLYIATGGITVNGGAFGEDGSVYNSISGNQGRYGVTTAADLASVGLFNVEATGATDAYQLIIYTTSKNNVLVSNNRKVGATRPNYATVPTSISPAATTVATTWLRPYLGRLFVYGGTVTKVEVNSATVSDTVPCSFEVGLGDTYTLTYSSAPTLMEQRLA
jgi:hypothetical protein